MPPTDKTIEEIAKKNPLVDLNLLREAQKLAEEEGVPQPHYDIEPPYGGNLQTRLRNKSQSSSS